MWLAGWLRQQVTITTPTPTTDRFGNTVLATGTDTVVLGYVQPRRATEDTIGDQTSEQTGIAFLPPDTAVGPTSKLTVDGVTYDVTGVVPRSFAGRSHLEVLFRRDDRSV
jgi:hypothetical protein